MKCNVCETEITDTCQLCKMEKAKYVVKNIHNEKRLRICEHCKVNFLNK
jgi:hypothetical protein